VLLLKHKDLLHVTTLSGFIQANVSETVSFEVVAYPGILFGGVQQIQLRTGDRQNGDLGGGSLLLRGSEGSCNLVQEISFHVVKVS